MADPDAAVAIVRTSGPDPAILLMRRAERAGDPWSGHWSLPGGRWEKSDGDLLTTALRELQEECGIRLRREQVNVSLPPAVARRHTGRFLLVAPYVFDIDGELPTVLDAREATGALWMPQHTLLDPGQHRLQQVPEVPGPTLFPAIALPGAPLWGFTYRLLSDWLGMAPHENREAGFDVAQKILDFVLSRGTVLRRDWYSVEAKNRKSSGTVRTATVSGMIPAREVMEHFSAPGAYVALVNRIEIRPDFIRITGLAFEEYLIEACS